MPKLIGSALGASAVLLALNFPTRIELKYNYYHDLTFTIPCAAIMGYFTGKKLHSYVQQLLKSYTKA